MQSIIIILTYFFKASHKSFAFLVLLLALYSTRWLKCSFKSDYSVMASLATAQSWIFT